METLAVRHGAWVVIGDGKKALVLHNEGDAELLNLRRVSVRESDNPATRDQGPDQPGRASAAVVGAASAMEQTNWHQIEADRFAASLAQDINTAAGEQLCKELIVVAPPKTLAELRREFCKDAQNRIVGELAKDDTHHTIPEMSLSCSGIGLNEAPTGRRLGLVISSPLDDTENPNGESWAAVWR